MAHSFKLFRRVINRSELLSREKNVDSTSVLEHSNREGKRERARNRARARTVFFWFVQPGVDFKSVCWSLGIAHSFFAVAASKGGASPREMDFNVAGAMS
jgi:hypothetical protein